MHEPELEVLRREVTGEGGACWYVCMVGCDGIAVLGGGVKFSKDEIMFRGLR